MAVEAMEMAVVEAAKTRTGGATVGSHVPQKASRLTLPLHHCCLRRRRATVAGEPSVPPPPPGRRIAQEGLQQSGATSRSQAMRRRWHWRRRWRYCQRYCPPASHRAIAPSERLRVIEGRPQSGRTLESGDSNRCPRSSALSAPRSICKDLPSYSYNRLSNTGVGRRSAPGLAASIVP